MEEYPEVPDGAKTRRAYLLKDRAKTLAIFPFVVAAALLAGNGAASPHRRTLGIAVGVSAVLFAGWAFLSPTRCPRCGGRMKRRVEAGFGGELFLDCERCRARVDLDLTDPNP
ncbi:hypothetical protein DB347_20130 [Opitutaceae bacterium EW11]|nr:hypothetical protein DB347_20130 [Opitutaceae bacterium EW11]